MFVGITIVSTVLLPRIYVCPGGASCASHFKPTPDVLSRVQALMGYWLVIGMLISGFGLGKLMGYHAWLMMRQRGSTVKDIQSTLMAIEGSILDVAILVWKRHSRVMGLVFLIPVGISAIISLVIALSISDISTHGQVEMEFNYKSSFTMLTLVFDDFTFMTSQRTATNRLDFWLLTGDRSHGVADDKFQGSFVVPDNRTIFATNAQPGGSHIMTSVACYGNNISAVPAFDGIYNITTTITEAVIDPAPSYLLAAWWWDRNVESTETGENYVVIRYFWTSNTSAVIPNATTSTDGKLYVAQCNHTIWASKIPHEEGMQVVKPSIPITPLTPTVIKYNATVFHITNQGAALLSLGNTISSWWRTRESSTFRTLSCRMGIIAPFDDLGEPCRLNNETWGSTVTAMVDAVVQAGKKSGNATQRLLLRAESISRKRWWWQAAIPIATLLFYIACLGYTFCLNGARRCKQLTKLDLCEIINTCNASQEEKDTAVTELTEVGPMPL